MAGATVVTLVTSSPPDAAALVVGVSVGSSNALADALVDRPGVLVAVGFAEEGAIRCARSAADRLVTSRIELALVIVARIAEPPVSTARVTTAAAACVATVVVRATVDVTVEITAVVVEREVETAAATGAVCTAGAMFAGATGGVATFGAAGTGGALGAAGAGAAGVGAAGSGLAADDCVVSGVWGATAAAAAGSATADCVAVAAAGAAGVLGTPARATSTKAAEQARTPANRTGRIRRLLTRVNTQRLLSARHVV